MNSKDPLRKPESPSDPDLTTDEIAQLNLSKFDIERIDNQLLAHTHLHWRKAALIIVNTMDDLEKQNTSWTKISYLFYAMRLRALVADKKLEAQGNLYNIRSSEVRLPVGSFK